MFLSGMEQMFPGIFGMEQLCSGRGGDSGPWVIPGGDSAPTRCSSRCQVSGEGRNITGTCGAELLFSHEGRRLRPNYGRVSGLTTVHHATKSLVRGGICPEVLGGTFVPFPQGGDSGHPRRRLHPPEVFPGNLRRKFRSRKGCNGTIFGRAYISDPLLPGGVSWQSSPVWILSFSHLH